MIDTVTFFLSILSLVEIFSNVITFNFISFYLGVLRDGCRTINFLIKVE